MANLNKVILIGRLTRDPETRFLQSGSAITEFGLAINRTYKVNDEKREEVTFVEITGWGAGGETVAKHMTKGKQLLVEGRLKFEQWESQAGEKRSKLVVVMERFQFIGGGKDQDQGPARNSDSIEPGDFGGNPQPAGASGDMPF